MVSDNTPLHASIQSVTSTSPGASCNDPWTILKIITWTEAYFQSFDVDSPRLTAEILLCHALNIRRLDLYLQFDRPLNQSELFTYKNLIRRRVRKEPVAYITGVKGFWDLQFCVTPDVLIPRPDTETLVELALATIDQKKNLLQEDVYDCQRSSKIQQHYKDTNRLQKRRLKVLELGTGSGAIAVSLAKAHPDVLFYATDISYQAIIVAMKNSANAFVKSSESVSCDLLTKNFSSEADCSSISRAGLPNLFFLTGSWFSAIKPDTEFDVIVSNPPYIPTGDIEDLQQEVRDHEPVLALDGGAEGVSCLKQIMESAPDYLAEDGVLLMEMGFDQKQKMKDISLLIHHYDTPEFVKDYAGHDRVVSLKKKIKIIENKNKI